MASNPPKPGISYMSFGDHLEELRKRILLAMAIPIPLSIITFMVSDTLIEWLVLPLSRVLTSFDLPVTLQALSPPETIMVQFKLSLISALILSAPWLLWQLWMFIGPGLYQQERRFVHFLIPGSAILTAAGVALMYFLMLPLMLWVLVNFGEAIQLDSGPASYDARIVAVMEATPAIEVVHVLPEAPEAGRLMMLWPDMKLFAAVADDSGGVEVLKISPPTGSIISQEYHISKYINFVLMMFLAIVFAFQTPLVVLLLGWMGLVSPQWLQQNRKYALMICAVVSAIITPADVVSMIAMLIPIYGLYELGILLLRIAPASKVAEGTILSSTIKRKVDADKPAPDKQDNRATQPTETAQTEDSAAPSDSAEQSHDNQSDGGGDS